MDSIAKSIVAMVATVIVAVLVVAFVITCSGCSRTDEQPVIAAGGRFVEIAKLGDLYGRSARIIEDTETGVQYMLVIGSHGSVAITPILKADGTPYTGENSSLGAEAYMPRRGVRTETEAVA